MLGYCSNSPLRCEKARTIEIMNQADFFCPECSLFLIPATNISQQLRTDVQFLRLSVLVTVSILFVSVNIHYLIFS